MKSALGRGGVVENITLRNIYMSEIKGEAVILTMSYVLNSLNRNETVAMENEEDIPYFRNLSMENIEVTGCRQFTKLEPLQGRPETIRNVVVNGPKLVSGSRQKTDFCYSREIFCSIIAGGNDYAMYNHISRKKSIL